MENGPRYAGRFIVAASAIGRRLHCAGVPAGRSLNDGGQ
jgi:hypothetical protein